VAKLAPQQVICTRCLTSFEGTPKYSFLGLLRFECPNCRQKFLYPMSDRRRRVYWGIAIAFGVIAVLLLVTTGVVAVPGILVVGVIIGLVQDANARKSVAQAQAQWDAWSQAHPSPGAGIGDVR
jgi:TRAP-type mannitol/chloroaromatic compound transport system permease large subunit